MRYEVSRSVRDAVGTRETRARVSVRTGACDGFVTAIARGGDIVAAATRMRKEPALSLVAAVALVLGCAEPAAAPSAPAAAPSDDPFALQTVPSGRLTPPARDLTIDIEHFVAPGYRVTTDETIGTQGWRRVFSPQTAVDFQWFQVSVFVFPPDVDATMWIADQTCRSVTFANAPTTSRDVVAPVIGDGAKACAFGFADGGRVYQYVTGTRNAGFALDVAPARDAVGERLTALGRRQIAFAYAALAAVSAAAPAATAAPAGARPFATAPVATAPPASPAVTAPPAGPVVIFEPPALLPPAVAGAAYLFSFCVPAPASNTSPCGPFPQTTDPRGGQPPYHFQLDSGSGFPPIGTSVGKDGLLTGTPAPETAGLSYPFRVCAIDLGGNAACRNVSIVVTAPVAATVTPIPVAFSLVQTSRTCVVRERFADGSNTWWIDIAGTASGPVGTVVTAGTSAATPLCGAWGPGGNSWSCERRGGDGPNVQWSFRFPGTPRSLAAVSRGTNQLFLNHDGQQVRVIEFSVLCP